MRQLRRKPILVLAVSLLALSATGARSEDGAAGGNCSQRYHASLGRIAGAEYQALKEARRAPAAATPAPVMAAEPGLPGSLLFPPFSAGQRTREETAALRLAVSLARSKGRSTGAPEADAAWMADRLRMALGDYLTQGPSPYLCGGVEAYVAELRGDSRRVAVAPAERERLLAVQKTVAAKAVAAALSAMKPVPAPGEKPVGPAAGATMVYGPPRPADSRPVEGLRPAAGLDRVDMTIHTGSTSAEPADDPDLPKLQDRTPPPYETPADLIAAVNKLFAAAKNGHFIEEPRPGGPILAPRAIPALDYPVLARLAEIQPAVSSVGTLVRDRTVRLRLSAALSAIEMLDYLMRVRAETPDPMATAIDATFEAILKAHAADCTCQD